MKPGVIEGRLRRFLLVVVAVLCAGTILELLLADHTKEPNQLIPFALCGLGIGVSLAVLWRPGQITIRVLRIVMVGMALGSLLGMWLHFSGNYAFQVDIRPNGASGDSILAALKGAAPLLAPGILALAAVLALAATYDHPALQHEAEAIISP